MWRWIHEYQDACVDKLERFMRGELNSKTEGAPGKFLATNPMSPNTPNLGRLPNYPRAGSLDGSKSTNDS